MESTQNDGPLFIRYGGRQAPVLLFLAALLMAAAASLGWRMNTPLSWGFAGAAGVCFVFSVITRNIVVCPGEKSIRIAWLLAGRFSLQSRKCDLAQLEAILIQRYHVPESESGYGTINVLLKTREEKKIPLQTYHISEPDFSCPQAECLIAQMTESTGLPVEEHVIPSGGW